MSYIVKICFIGDSSQGKSSIASRFTDDRCQKNYELDKNIQEIKIIWDLTGDQISQEINKMEINGILGCFLIYDIENKESFENLKEQFKYQYEQLTHNCKNQIEFLFIGYDSDQEDIKRQIDYEEGNKFAESKGIQFFECKSNDDSTIEYIFQLMTEKIIIKIINNQFIQQNPDFNNQLNQVLLLQQHPDVQIVKSNNSIENINTEKNLNTKEYVIDLVKLLIIKQFNCLCQNHQIPAICLSFDNQNKPKLICDLCIAELQDEDQLEVIRLAQLFSLISKQLFSREYNESSDEKFYSDLLDFIAELKQSKYINNLYINQVKFMILEYQQYSSRQQILNLLNNRIPNIQELQDLYNLIVQLSQFIEFQSISEFKIKEMQCDISTFKEKSQFQIKLLKQKQLTYNKLIDFNITDKIVLDQNKDLDEFIQQICLFQVENELKSDKSNNENEKQYQNENLILELTEIIKQKEIIVEEQNEKMKQQSEQFQKKILDLNKQEIQIDKIQIDNLTLNLNKKDALIDEQIQQIQQCKKQTNQLESDLKNQLQRLEQEKLLEIQEHKNTIQQQQQQIELLMQKIALYEQKSALKQSPLQKALQQMPQPENHQEQEVPEIVNVPQTNKENYLSYEEAEKLLLEYQENVPVDIQQKYYDEQPKIQEIIQQEQNNPDQKEEQKEQEIIQKPISSLFKLFQNQDNEQIDTVPQIIQQSILETEQNQPSRQSARGKGIKFW